MNNNEPKPTNESSNESSNEPINNDYIDDWWWLYS